MVKCYYCETCNFKTHDKFMYSKHLKRGKHIKLNGVPNQISIRDFVEKLNIQPITDKGIVVEFD